VRKYHRWLSTIGMLLLAWVAVTGTVLTVDELLDQQSFAEPTINTVGGDGGGLRGANSTAAGFSAEQLEPLLSTGLHAALSVETTVAPTAVRVQLRMRDGQPQAVVTIDAVDTVPTKLTFNAATGAQITNAPASLAGGGRGAPGGPPSFNGLMQSLHGGSIAGKAGEWFILLTGAFFVVLSITGIWMYFQLRGARVKIRRSEWFW
jgi:hypothetical protein